MIVWFTQPPGKFASYYQLDPATKHFVRIRLELERKDGPGYDSNTFVDYEETRHVGFFEKNNLNAKDLKRWSVDADGTLCYDNKALSKTAEPGSWVYDRSAPSFVHPGSQVVAGSAAKLPDGIRAEHLELLANEAFITKSYLKLSDPDVSPEDLAGLIKEQVCRVVGVNDFAEVEGRLAETLRSQTEQIARAASVESASALDDSLKEAKGDADEIAKEMVDGALTPTEALETGVGQLRTAIDTAQTVPDEDPARKLAAVEDAEKSLDTVLEATNRGQEAALAEQLKSGEDALAYAQKSAAALQNTEAEFKPLEGAETVEDYNQELAVETEEGV